MALVVRMSLLLFMGIRSHTLRVQILVNEGTQKTEMEDTLSISGTVSLMEMDGNALIRPCGFLCMSATIGDEPFSPDTFGKTRICNITKTAWTAMTPIMSS